MRNEYPERFVPETVPSDSSASSITNPYFFLHDTNCHLALLGTMGLLVVLMCAHTSG
jgi:hypothetical protein